MSEVMIIESEEQAVALVKKALAGEYDDSVVELSFEGWPKMELRIRGERYHSTITPSMMRALLELQTELNRVYAETIYGKSIRELTPEERKSLEIVYKVEDGCTKIETDLGRFLLHLADAGVEKMTGGEIVITILGVALIFAGASSFRSHGRHKEKVLEEERKAQAERNRHELEMQMIAANKNLGHVKSGLEQSFTGVLRSVQDADSISSGDVTLTKSQVEDIIRPERNATRVVRMDGDYTVTSMKRRDDQYTFELVSAENGDVVTASAYHDKLASGEVESMADSFSKDAPIALRIGAKINDTRIVSASVIGLAEDKPE